MSEDAENETADVHAAKDALYEAACHAFPESRDVVATYSKDLDVYYLELDGQNFAFDPDEIAAADDLKQLVTKTVSTFR